MGTSRVLERRRAVALARHYREFEGLSIREIGDRLGRSPATVKAYFYDPPDANKTPTDAPCANDCHRSASDFESSTWASRPEPSRDRTSAPIATHNARTGNGTILFSLEMSEGELADRHFASHARIPYGKIRAANLAKPDFDRIAAGATSWSKDTRRWSCTSADADIRRAALRSAPLAPPAPRRPQADRRRLPPAALRLALRSVREPLRARIGDLSLTEDAREGARDPAPRDRSTLTPERATTR